MAFLVCYLWDTIDSILLVAGYPPPPAAREIQILFTLLNFAVNPVAHAFHKREMRRELRRLFHCNMHRDLQDKTEVTEAHRLEVLELRCFRNRVGQQITDLGSPSTQYDILKRANYVIA